LEISLITVVLFLSLQTYAFEFREGQFVGSDLSQPLQCSFLYSRDGDTLPDRVPGLRVRETGSYPRVAQSLMVQN
jgi:hypothetical protein